MTKDDLLASRRRISHQKQQRVLETIEILGNSGARLTVSGVAKAARVSRSLIYNHPELLELIKSAAQDGYNNESIDSSAPLSLVVTNANLESIVRQQSEQIAILERRLSVLLGRSVVDELDSRFVDRGESEKDRREEIATLEQKCTELEIQNRSLEEQLEAARNLNRRILKQNNLGRD